MSNADNENLKTNVMFYDIKIYKVSTRKKLNICVFKTHYYYNSVISFHIVSNKINLYWTTHISL